MDGSIIVVPRPGAMPGLNIGDKCCIVVRPESVELSEEEGLLSGVVKRATYYGAKIEYEIERNGQSIIVENYNPQLTKRFEEGNHVSMKLISQCLRVLA